MIFVHFEIRMSWDGDQERFICWVVKFARNSVQPS